jgi:hypothetical protein
MTTSPLQTSPDSSNKLQITYTETKGTYTNTKKKKTKIYLYNLLKTTTLDKVLLHFHPLT